MKSKCLFYCDKDGINEMGSRMEKSIKNTIMAFVEQIICSLISFVCRTIFIYTLGRTYLGFDGLFGDLLLLLSLAEMGVSTAIIYSMYEPAAHNDYRRIAALLNIYKKIYFVISIIIMSLGLLLLPHLDFFISDIPEMPELPVIYLLYLLNTVISYLFIYKKSILTIDQRDYVSSLIYAIAIVVQNIFQILFLLITHNFIIYLIIQLIGTLGNNVAISAYVDKRYTFLKEYKDAKVDKRTQKDIYINVRAMFLSRLSSVIVTSTDNILISKFVSTVTLGLYSNYTLFTKLMRNILTKIFTALTGSIGNLVVLESKEKIYRIFKQIWFVNFWLVSFSCVLLFVLVNSFLELWLGRSYVLEVEVVFIVCLNLYMRLIRNTFLIFIETYGLFEQIKYKCIAEAIINLVSSLVLLIPLHMGIYGVLLGTFISNILTNFWYEPYILYVKKFEISLNEYFITFIKYFIVTIFTGMLMFFLCNSIIIFSGWIGFMIKVTVCILVINSIYVIIYRKTPEFAYFITIIKKISEKISKKGSDKGNSEYMSVE